MGIPKFFRYVSERYPLTSQLIEENKIPEFDNLYVDFNGIIHNCSHPDDNDAHLRLSEEQIFTAIFAYVDHLFGKIKPKKLFFMAVDGVAPRAKMNQQRSRRFRTAREAQELRERAERKGEKLPEEKAFDSNCITPGTPFMARLSAQLRYFVNKKISEDADWSGVEVVLSGHDVPGEGEHKIMEYIRLSKAQPGYNSNTRHCLYGLDADLIMLGLLSHDPHFCLLREEVKFGPAARRKTTNLQQQNFYLLHLCLLREYLDLEFRSIATSLSFPYNLERIIDDFVLLAVFVGNDFLPHLPDLHIHENGLERLFNIYKTVLPKAGGYINNSGVIDTARLQIVLNELAESEVEVFQREMGDLSWIAGKQEERRTRKRSHKDEIALAKKKGSLVLTYQQQGIFHRVRDAVLAQRKAGPQKGTSAPPITFPNHFNARDKKFITTLAGDLNLTLAWDGFDDEDRNIVTLSFPDLRPAHATQIDENGIIEDDEDEWEDTSGDDMEESNTAVDRVLSKYSKAKVLAADDDEHDGFEAREAQRLKLKMDEWKRGYYKEKLEISYDDPQALNTLVFRWVEGLQWVMFYYYSGVASWGWFYDYHYAPRISDFKGVDKMIFTFDLGTPFRPYQQLMGVLPAASQDLIPLAYRDLMYDPNSPILDFYPVTFDLDMNGKKAEWEAIVKIPFLDQERLLRAMAARDHRLTPEEVQRNSFGLSTRFTYDPDQDSVFPSSLPGFFAAIHHCKCRMEPFNLPTLDGLHLVEGLCDGVFLGTAALAGFPSLKTLPHTGRLEYHHVNVFQAESRNQSMVVEIENDFAGKKTADIAEMMVGKKTFIGWPFLQEGLVVAVSDELFRHEMRPFGASSERRLAAAPHSQVALSRWHNSAARIEEVYSKRFAVITGPVEFLLHVRPLKGLKRLDTGALVKDYEGPEKEVEQAVQLGLHEVISEDPRYLEKDAPPLSVEFPVGSRIIFMGEHAYGVAAQVQSTNETSLSVILAFFPSEKAEIEKFTKVVSSRSPGNYFQSYDVANMVGISGLALAKIASSFMVLHTDGTKTNLGLSLKFEAKGLKVMDYSRKIGRVWEFSRRAVDLIREYKTKFPELFRSLNNRSDDMLHGADIFRQENSDAKIKEVKAWLTAKGVREFEPVSLTTDRLSKETVMEIERVADLLNSTKSAAAIKKAVVQGIPRQAVLKPAHAVYRLQNQTFALGDRVTMVQDSGSVPLCAKGVVIGVNDTSIDVVWDVPFISGTKLGDRCSEYRGSVMPFNTCLNLTNRQYSASTKPKVTAQPAPIVPPKQAQKVAPGLRGQHAPQPQSQPTAPMHIMKNPNRGPASHAPRNGRVPGGLPPAPPPAITAVNGVPSYGATLRDQGGSSLPAPAPPRMHKDILRDTLVYGAEPSSSRSTQAPDHHGNVHHPHRPNHHVKTYPQGQGGAGRSGIGASGGRNDRAPVAPKSSAVLPRRERGGTQRGSRDEGGQREKGGRPPTQDPVILSVASPAAP